MNLIICYRHVKIIVRERIYFHEIHAMVVAVDMMIKYEIPLSIENLKVDDSIWRSMLEHELNMIDNGVPLKINTKH